MDFSCGRTDAPYQYKMSDRNCILCDYDIDCRDQDRLQQQQATTTVAERQEVSTMQTPTTATTLTPQTAANTTSFDLDEALVADKDINGGDSSLWYVRNAKLREKLWHYAIAIKVSPNIYEDDDAVASFWQTPAAYGRVPRKGDKCRVYLSKAKQEQRGVPYLDAKITAIMRAFDNQVFSYDTYKDKNNSTVYNAYLCVNFEETDGKIDESANNA